MNKTILQIGLIVLAIACMVCIVLLRLTVSTEVSEGQLLLGRLAALVMAGVFIYFSYTELLQAKIKESAVSTRLVSVIRVPMYIFAGAFMLYVSYVGVQV